MSAQERIADALQSDKLDRCIAQQSQSSGTVNARMTALRQLNETATRELQATKQELAEGIILAKKIKHDLQSLQNRIRRCQEQI